MNYRNFDVWRNAEYMYDSDVQSYSMAEISRVLYGKRNVLVLIETTDGNRFGVFHPTIPTREEVLNSPWDYLEFNDPNLFLYSLKRCDKKQFEFKLFNKRKGKMGDIGLCKTEKDNNYIYWIGNAFYICGKIGEIASSSNVYLSYYFEMESPYELTSYTEREKWFAVERFSIFKLPEN